MHRESQSRTVIVGAGQAGRELALALRQTGWAGPVVMVGEEPHLPYQRPPLSKSFLKGEIEQASLCLTQQDTYERADIDVRLNVRVERVDTRSRTVALASGEELAYTALALTTGGRATQLTGGDASRAALTDNFHYLRTIADAIRIRSRFHAGRHLVVIGGGYIGLEVAAAAVMRGLRVTVLEALPRVLARVTAPELSAFYEREHRAAGVDLRTRVAVTGFEIARGGKEVTAVRCSDGTVVPADAVVVGIGLTPNTELAQAAGLVVEQGIVVDEYARTSDPHIVAAGDCTSHSQLVAGSKIRVESVPNAIEQGRVAAATLGGKPRAYAAVPWFWSDQYDLKLQMAGLSRGCDGTVIRGSLASRSFAVLYLREGRLIACDAVNRPGDFIAARRLVEARLSPDPAALADESIPLKSLFAVGRP